MDVRGGTSNVKGAEKIRVMEAPQTNSHEGSSGRRQLLKLNLSVQANPAPTPSTTKQHQDKRTYEEAAAGSAKLGIWWGGGGGFVLVVHCGLRSDVFWNGSE